MYFDDMETGKIQDLFSESSFCTRSLLYSCVQFIIKHSAIIIINSTAFFNFHFLLGVTYILSYSVYFFILFAEKILDKSHLRSVSLKPMQSRTAFPICAGTRTTVILVRTFKDPVFKPCLRTLKPEKSGQLS